jgi:hypothetical protein
MKASGGCENLETQAVGRGKPGHSCRCPVRGYAVGEKTSWEELSAFGLYSGRSTTAARRLAYSVGERKPMRGFLVWL